MYKLENTDYITCEPWNLQFPIRLKELIDAHAIGLKTVVYLYEKADTSTFRYRAYNMCETLLMSAEWCGVYFFSNELEILKKFISNIDCVVIVRYRWDLAIDTFINLTKEKNIRILFDVDDLVYDQKYISLITYTLGTDMTLGKKCDYWFSYTGRMHYTALKCDAFVSTNNYIAKMIERDMERKCYVVPNYYNRLQLIASEDLCIQKRTLEQEREFCIGYFSGSPSHVKDFLVVAPELKRLMEECKDVCLKIVGFMELPSYMKTLQKEGRIKLVSLKNFIDLQKEIAEVDVNIIPLQENEFTNCKSELKYFEASIVETVSCASPTYVYRQIIDSGINGFLCNPGEWYGTLKQLYEKGIDKSVVDNAKKLSFQYYCFKNQVKVLENILNQVTKEEEFV